MWLNYQNLMITVEVNHKGHGQYSGPIKTRDGWCRTRENTWFWFYFCSVEERITRVFYGNRAAQLIRNQYYFSTLKWKVLRGSNSIITSRSHVNFVSNLLFKWSTTREIEWELFSENDVKEIKISPLMLAPLSKGAQWLLWTKTKLLHIIQYDV